MGIPCETLPKRAKVLKKWAWPTFFAGIGGGTSVLAEPEGRLDRIESVVVPVVRSHGLSLVDLEFRREGHRWVLRLYVDKPGGVGIADCQRLSHELGDVLDVTGLIEESYDLEVSSPGLDRQLRKEREFRWAVGKPVRCWVSEPIDGRREFAGVLAAATDEGVSLTGPDGTVTLIPRRLLTKARLDPALPRRGTGRR
jgi:ribosome maturation factor RimP